MPGRHGALVSFLLDSYIEVIQAVGAKFQLIFGEVLRHNDHALAVNGVAGMIAV